MASIGDLIIRFRSLFKNYFYDEIKEMVAKGRRSLTLDFNVVKSYDEYLAALLLDRPTQAVEAASQAVRGIVAEESPGHSGLIYRVRLMGIPRRTSVKDLRAAHMGKLVEVCGKVKSLGEVSYLAHKARFRCSACGYELGYTAWSVDDPVLLPKRCPRCGLPHPFTLLLEESHFIDMRKALLSDGEGEVEVLLYDELVDAVRPGEEVCVVGVLKPRVLNLSRTRLEPKAVGYLEANNVIKR